jgi:Peptidase_C39 like family
LTINSSIFYSGFTAGKGGLSYNGSMTIDSSLSVGPSISTTPSIDRGSSSTEIKQTIQSFADTLRIMVLMQFMSSWDASSGDTSINGTGGSLGSSVDMSTGLMSSMMSLYEQLISQQIQDATSETDQESTNPASLGTTLFGSAQASFHHINQFLAELQVGGDGANADCGPTSLIMALHQLGLRVAGETSGTNDGEAVDLARLSMVTSSARDGVDANGNRVDAEHSTYTNFGDLARGAAAAGAKSQTITASAAGIQSALQSGASVIASGTFAGKYPLPWTGDRGIDNNTAPGHATAHLIEISAYDPSSNTFTIHDPARVQAIQVSAAALEQFMAGNAGAMALWK